MWDLIVSIPDHCLSFYFSLCTHYSLFKCIEQATHLTETSTSLIDILLVSNKDHLILSGVGDPFLNQDIRYHCPIYGIFKFTKPNAKRSNVTYGTMNMVIMSSCVRKHLHLTGILFVIKILTYSIRENYHSKNNRHRK